MTQDAAGSRAGARSTDRGPLPDADVTALRSCPDRTVFSENGNADGWISTDLTVGLER